MRTLRFVSCMTLVLVATATATASTVAAAPVQRPASLRSDLYAWMVVDRRLGDPYDKSLLRQLQSQSGVEHFRDGSRNPIAVVKLELLNNDGTSRTRLTYGSYPFCVVREIPNGLVLMGEMFGSDYRSTFNRGALEFHVDLHPTATRTVKMRFRVENNTLVNLTPQGSNKDMYLATPEPPLRARERDIR